MFDLSEIYARRFRQKLKENKGKLTKGMDFVQNLHALILADFAERRLVYDSATNYSTDAKAQAVWEQIIQDELEALSSYSVETK